MIPSSGCLTQSYRGRGRPRPPVRASLLDAVFIIHGASPGACQISLQLVGVQGWMNASQMSFLNVPGAVNAALAAHTQLSMTRTSIE